VQKSLREFAVWLTVSTAVISTATACVPRKAPAPNDGMSAMEYYQGVDRADWLNKQLKNASLTIRDGELGHDSDATPGKVANPFVTMEVEVRQNGQPNFRRPTRIALEPNGNDPSISFEIRGDGTWDVCISGNGCSSSLASDGMSANNLVKHDERAVDRLNDLLDSQVQSA